MPEKGPRSRFPSDDARLKVKPHVRIHHSITNHPRMVEVYQDDRLLATWLRLLIHASEKGAAHTGDWVSLSRHDVERITAKRRADVAATSLERLADVLGWCWERDGNVTKILIRNFARKQNIATRIGGGNSAHSAASPSPSPLPSLKDPPIAPQGGRVDSESSFAEFWKSYPRKTAKKAAAKAWNRLTAAARCAALADVRRRISSTDWTRDGGRFVPHGASYLNGERWTDEPLPEPQGTPADSKINGIRRLRLTSGKIIEVRQGQRLQFTDAPDALDVYELPNGTLSVKSGATWLRN